jgi:two-component system response regulator AtoC
MVTAVNEARTAVDCLKKGAYDYLVKPITRDDLLASINRALERKRLLSILELDKSPGCLPLVNARAFNTVITGSAKMRKLLREAELQAASNVPILITGESGTGKELLARAIHQASPRADRLFAPVNMASIPTTLFDAEFFGHTKGAFTGAGGERSGYLQYADGGTLFLDEIGSFPLDLQGKLLRVLQEGEYLKIGESRPRKTNLRFITATNMDLQELIGKGLFRKDLYYRLKGAWLHLPPLRERNGDVPLLVKAFLDEQGQSPEGPKLDPEAMTALLGYDFPGNVRELRSIIQSALNLSGGGVLTPRHLPAEVVKGSRSRSQSPAAGISPRPPLAEVEREHILDIYRETGKNKALASKKLGIGLNTLRRKLEAYGVH